MLLRRGPFMRSKILASSAVGRCVGSLSTFRMEPRSISTSFQLPRAVVVARGEGRCLGF